MVPAVLHCFCRGEKEEKGEGGATFPVQLTYNTLL